MSTAAGTTTRSDVPRPARIAVLASGGGSNLQALIDHFHGEGRVHGEIVLVGLSRSDCGAATRAESAGIATVTFADPGDSAAILGALHAAAVDVIALAGYLKMVPADVVAAYHGRCLNVHPSLLPSFGGAGMFGERVHAAVIAAGAAISGVTVHFVDEEFDRGTILAQWPVPVLESDTPATLAARVLHVEHRLYPRCVAALASGAVTLDDARRVRGVPRELRPEFV